MIRSPGEGAGLATGGGPRLGDSPRGGSLLVRLLPVDCLPLEGSLLGNRSLPGDRLLLGGSRAVGQW